MVPVLKANWVPCRKQKDEFCFLIHPTNLRWRGSWSYYWKVDWYNFIMVIIAACVASPILCYSNHSFVLFLYSLGYLLLSLAWSRTSRIFCRDGLVDMNSFSMFVPWKVLLSPTMVDSLAGAVFFVDICDLLELEVIYSPLLIKKTGQNAENKWPRAAQPQLTDITNNITSTPEA